MLSAVLPWGFDRKLSVIERQTGQALCKAAQMVFDCTGAGFLQDHLVGANWDWVRRSQRR